MSGLSILAALLTRYVLVRTSTGIDAAADHLPLEAKTLFGIAILSGIWMVLPKAVSAIRRLQPDMNLLMTIAVIGAVAIGEWLEGATVAFLFSLSLLLESWSVSRARRAVAALLDLSPPTARVVRANGTIEEVSPEQVAIDDKFLNSSSTAA